METLILIVEDDPLTREALGLVLGMGGFKVEAAENGQEGLRRLRAGLRPRLIILDLMMPEMDGWQFRLEQGRDPELATIPVLVVSAAADLNRNAAGLGVAGVLPKPIDFDRLLGLARGLAAREKPGVLVVDDELPIRRLLEIALQKFGFRVWTAAGGKEAIEVYRQHAGDIALALLDVQMPGLDGPATLAALRQVNPDLPCCFMSGHTGAYDAATLANLGAVAIFQKPFALADVVSTLRQVVGPVG